MKKSLTLFLSFVATFSIAQWTSNVTQIYTSQKVGIGTTTPNDILEIFSGSGSLKFNGFRLNLNDGKNNYFLGK